MLLGVHVVEKGEWCGGSAHSASKVKSQKNARQIARDVN